MHLDDSPDKGSSAASSIRMLKEVLDGRTYESVASDFGVSRTAVEKRVKGMTTRIARGAAIEGLNENSVNFIGRLRAQRKAVLEALQRFDPELALESQPPRVVTAEEINRAASLLRARSRVWKRDVALLYVIFATGARPIEIARLEVRDYLNADGTVRRRSELRSEASISSRSRPLFFSSRRLDEALADYLSERRDLHLGSGTDDSYRGLHPESRLFLSQSGEAFEIAPHRANERNLRCKEIQQVYRRIFRWAELRWATPLSIRHTLVARLYERGADEDQVGVILGINDRGVRTMYPRHRPTLTQLVEDLF